MKSSCKGKSGKAFENIFVTRLQVIDNPCQVEMSSDEIQSLVQIVNIGGALFLVKEVTGHAAPKLNICHYFLNS